MKTSISIFFIIIFLAVVAAGIYYISSWRQWNIWDPPEMQIELVEVVKTDTIFIEKTIYDTFQIKEVKFIYIEQDTIAVAEYQPDMEELKGSLKIGYSYRDKKFEIINNLIVHQKTVEKTIEKTVIQPPPLMRGTVLMGLYGSKNNGIFQIGAGVLIRNRIAIYLSALSTRELGLCAAYNW